MRIFSLDWIRRISGFGYMVDLPFFDLAIKCCHGSIPTWDIPWFYDFFLPVSTYLFLARLRKNQNSRSVGIVHWAWEVLYRLTHVSVTDILNMICRGSHPSKVAWKVTQSQSFSLSLGWTGRASLLFHDGEIYISGTVVQFFTAYPLCKEALIIFCFSKWYRKPNALFSFWLETL